MAEAQYVIFSLGTQKYCMQLSKIYGIEQSYVLVPVPDAHEPFPPMWSFGATER